MSQPYIKAQRDLENYQEQQDQEFLERSWKFQDFYTGCIKSNLSKILEELNLGKEVKSE